MNANNYLTIILLVFISKINYSKIVFFKLLLLIFFINSTHASQLNYSVIDNYLDNKISCLNKFNSNTNPSIFQSYPFGYSSKLLIDVKWSKEQEIDKSFQFKIQNFKIYYCKCSKDNKGLQAIKYTEKKLYIPIFTSTKIIYKEEESSTATKEVEVTNVLIPSLTSFEIAAEFVNAIIVGTHRSNGLLNVVESSEILKNNATYQTVMAFTCVTPLNKFTNYQYYLSILNISNIKNR